MNSVSFFELCIVFLALLVFAYRALTIHRRNWLAVCGMVGDHNKVVTMWKLCIVSLALLVVAYRALHLSTRLYTNPSSYYWIFRPTESTHNYVKPFLRKLFPSMCEMVDDRIKVVSMRIMMHCMDDTLEKLVGNFYLFLMVHVLLPYSLIIFLLILIIIKSEQERYNMIKESVQPKRAEKWDKDDFSKSCCS